MFKLVKVTNKDLDKYKKLSSYLKDNFISNSFAYSTKLQSNLITRRGKKIPWLQSKGSLGMAFSLKHSNPGIVGLILSFSLASIINGTTKWPNDVLLNGKKIAGLMAFVINSDEVVVGISINLNNKILAPEIKQIATSYYLEHKVEYNVDEFVKKLVKTFEYYLLNYNLDVLVSRDFLKNKDILINKDTFRFLTINSDGSGLFLKNGKKVTLTSLDISFNKIYYL